jgi:hypothetical protein
MDTQEQQRLEILSPAHHQYCYEKKGACRSICTLAAMAVNVVLYSEGVKHLDFRYNVRVLEAYNV